MTTHRTLFSFYDLVASPHLRAAGPAAPDEGAAPAAPAALADGFYVASKAKHGPRWRELRAAGFPVVSTWIDESEVGATSDWGDLWTRCIAEAAGAGALVVYAEPGEVLKGGLAEMGAALAMGRPVFATGIEDQSVRHHPLVTRAETLEDAVLLAMGHLRKAKEQRQGPSTDC